MSSSITENGAELGYSLDSGEAALVCREATDSTATSARLTSMTTSAGAPSPTQSAKEDREAAAFDGQSDDDLMKLAQAGVDSAFDELVRRYQLELLRVATRHLGSSVLAPDVTQNAFLQVYGALERYECRGVFRAYLHRVLLNQCRMAQRSARVSLKALERSELAPSSDEPQAFAREKRRDLERALDHLSHKLRDVVVLRYCGDLDYEEIAGTLAVPVGTVKRRLFDAMAKLRELLEPR